MIKPIIPFESGKYLYHYTRLESLEKILDSGILKFGALPQMNDITEASKDCYIECDNPELVNWNNLQLLESRLNTIGQISLAQDDLFPGYALHSMWGHYAEAGEGCCLVLDKESIIKEAAQLDYLCQKVSYGKDGAYIFIPDNMDVDQYLSKNFNKLFFQKRKEWEHEQEYRIINLKCDHSVLNGLPIKNSLLAVLFHTSCKHSIFDCINRQPYIEKLGLRSICALEYLYSALWGNENGDAILDKDGNDLLKSKIK